MFVIFLIVFYIPWVYTIRNNKMITDGHDVLSYTYDGISIILLPPPISVLLISPILFPFVSILFLFYWYFLSCLIVWAYNKLKKF